MDEVAKLSATFFLGIFGTMIVWALQRAISHARDTFRLEGQLRYDQDHGATPVLRLVVTSRGKRVANILPEAGIGSRNVVLQHDATGVSTRGEFRWPLQHLDGPLRLERDDTAVFGAPIDSNLRQLLAIFANTASEELLADVQLADLSRVSVCTGTHVLQTARMIGDRLQPNEE